MRLLAAASTFAAILAAPAAAQTIMDYYPGPNPGSTVEYYGPTSRLGAIGISSGDHWSRCVGGANVTAQRSIRSCGRIIGERISRVHTATAYYNRARHHEELGEAELMQADYARAIELFGAEIGARAGSSISYFNRGIVLAHFNDLDRAASDFQAAARLSPEWDEPHYRMGRILFQRGDYRAAIGAFDQAASLDPDDAYNHSNRCEARAAARTDPEGADAACAEALRLSGNDSHTLFSRGYLRFTRGDIEGASADFAAAFEKDQRNLYASYGMGVTASRLGRQSEAEIAFARAAELSEARRGYYANAGLRP
jgi:tetratricopeptide (TPR) repeat protein